MPLIDRIEQALDRGVDPDVFERAASALLCSRYTWLSPVEAGRDLGRDADIYRVLPGDPESRGRILATTGDALANLKRSHKSWMKEQASGDFRVDALVITTTKNLTGTARKKIDEYCRLQGLPLPEYYGRRWLVDALKNDAHWRETLVGVRGRLDALIPAPRSVTSDMPLLRGRESELELIRDHLEQRRDIVLSGVPGSGKTRIVGALGDAVFVDPLARDYLLDDLLALSPSTVVLDDAHLRPELLSELSRLRAQEGLQFRIIASCWPEETASTSSHLSDPAQLLLGLLPGDVMDDIVRGAGVSAIRARHLILNQAEGRPGWALTLCSAMVAASGVSVFSGETLLEHVLRHVRQEADSVLTIDLLASIAALGGAANTDLEKIAEIQRRPFPVVMSSLRRVATNGLIESVNGRWQLLTALVPALVSGWFFSASRLGSWTSLWDMFPERNQQLLASMLRAANTTGTKEAVAAAQEWAAGLDPASQWDSSTLELAREYALTGSSAASFAADAARVVLNQPRPSKVTLWGIEYDPISDAAAHVLRTCARAYCTEAAVHGLLDMATSDERPKHTHSDHPIRVLSDLAQHLDPDRGSIFHVREMLVNHLMTWTRSGMDNVLKWQVWAETVKEALSPTVEGAWSEPGSSSFTMASGLESAARLQELNRLWSTYVTASLKDVPVSTSGTEGAQALRHLIDLMGAWIRAAAGVGPGGSEVAADQRGAAAAGAWTILDDLAPILESHPGAAHLALAELDLAQQWGVVPPRPWPFILTDKDFEQFAGRQGNKSFEDWELHRDSEATEFANRLLQLGPPAGTAQFIKVARLASAVEIPDQGHPIPNQLAVACHDPIEWLREAVTGGSPVLTHRFMLESLRRNLPVPASLIDSALETDGVRSSVITAVVDADHFDETSRRVVRQLTDGDSVCLQRLFARDTAGPLLAALLVHPARSVRAETSLAFSAGVKHGPLLPGEWLELWRSAFLETSLVSVSPHSKWRLQKILEALSKSDPELCAEWFTRRLKDHDFIQGSLDKVEHLLRELPSSERKSLAIKCVLSGHNALLPQLIGYDAELAAALFEEGVIDLDVAMQALSGNRDSGVEILAPVLLAAGATPQRIAREVYGHISWSGPESESIRSEIEWFRSLAARNPELDPVSHAAIAELKKDYERALEEEQRERIKGR